MWGYDRADNCLVTDLNRKMVLDAFVKNWKMRFLHHYDITKRQRRKAIINNSK